MRTWVLVGLLVAAPVAAADWREFRGPNRSGVSDAKDVPTTWDAKTNVRWKIPLPGPGSSSPVLFGDRVYLTCYTGYGLDPKTPGDPKTLARHLLCVGRADGKVVRDAPIPAKAAEPGYGGFIAHHGYASSTPAVDADGVYVFYGASGADAVLVAGCDRRLRVLDARTGKELRGTDLGGQVAGTPSVVGDVAYVGTMDDEVVAADWKAARKGWAFRSRGSQAFFAPAAAADSLVVAGSRGGRVYAIDCGTGREAWAFAAGGRVDGSPAVDGGRVYFGTLTRDGPNFFALDLKTGRKLHELELDSAVGGSVAVGPDCVIVGTDRGAVYCLRVR